MTILQLKYFLAVCNYQSVSDAATYLFISQPSLSASIKELEKEFGVALFHRHHSGMSLTKEGETLYEYAVKIVEQANLTQTVMNDFSQSNKTLRLGVPPMIGSLILSDLYRDLSKCNLRLDLTESGRQALIKKLTDGLLDMAILPHNKPLDKRFDGVKLGRLEIVCCVSKQNEFASLNAMDIASLKGVPLVLFENSFFQTEEIKKRFSCAQITPNVLLQTNQVSTLVSVISSDIAVGFTFKELIENNNNLVGIPLLEPMFVDISLIWQKENYFSKTMNTFQEYVKQLHLFNV